MSENPSSSKQDYEDIKKLFENADSTINEDPATLLKLVRDKLYSMFCCPMKEDYSHEAFRWVSHLCMSIGDFSWISACGEWTKDESKIFSCIARLSIAEMHILFPLIQRNLTCGDEPYVEDGKILARSANSEDYNRFGDHLVILESVIKSLVKGLRSEDEDIVDDNEFNPLTNSMTGDELKNLLDSLKEAMTLNCDYLELVHRHWQELTEQMNNDKFSSAEGALRIMSVWLSEDSGSFEPQCKRFLLDLIIKSLLLNDRPTRDDLLILALHAICINNRELLEALKRTPRYKDALEKYLSFVQKEKSKSGKDRRKEKIFKLRCGLVKDLLIETGLD